MNIVPKEEKELLDQTDLPKGGEEGFKTSNDVKPDDSFLKDIVEEEPEKPSKEKEVSEDDEPRIPKKRFNKVYAERQEFEERLKQSDERINRLTDLLEKSLTSSQQKQLEKTTPEKWKKILGEDNPLTDEFYELLQSELAEQRKLAKEELNREWEERTQKESKVLTERTNKLEAEHNQFASSVGINLSTTEGDEALAKILEIQDELTPTDDNGKYAQPLIPLAVAYEVFKARGLSVQKGQKQNRDKFSGIVSAGRGGDVDTSRLPNKGKPDPSGWRKFLS